MAVESIAEGLRAFVITNEDLVDGRGLWIDYMGGDPSGYSIVPQPGTRIVESYINGKTLREYPFALQSAEGTRDDLERINSHKFFEGFAQWLEQQTVDGVFPELPSGLTPELIEAVQWGYLFEQGESGIGVYQIQCRLQYMQAKTVPTPVIP